MLGLKLARLSESLRGAFGCSRVRLISNGSVFIFARLSPGSLPIWQECGWRWEASGGGCRAFSTGPFGGKLWGSPLVAVSIV